MGCLMALTRQLASLSQCLLNAFEYSTLLQHFYNTQVTSDVPWKVSGNTPAQCAGSSSWCLHSLCAVVIYGSLCSLVRNSASATKVYAYVIP